MLCRAKASNIKAVGADGGGFWWFWWFWGIFWVVFGGLSAKRLYSSRCFDMAPDVFLGNFLSDVVYSDFDVFGGLPRQVIVLIDKFVFLVCDCG